MAAPKIVLHHLNNSRSQRILWLLEELEVPYKVKKYYRLPNQLAPPELLSVNPLGKSPVITDGDVTIAESGAIIEYIIEKYGKDKAQPPESGKLDNLYFTHYAEGSLMPLLYRKYIFTLIPRKSPWFLRPILSPVFASLNKALVEPEFKSHVHLLTSHLKKLQSSSSPSPPPWFAGGPNPTSADYQMLFPLETLASRDGVGKEVKEWVEMVHSRPAYKRALEKGGKYAYVTKAKL